MDLKILKENENKFFNRKDLEIELKHPKMATPAKSDLSKELATKYSVPEENVVIDYVFTKKGVGESFVKVKIYKEKPKVKMKKEKKVEKSEAQASEAK